MSTLKPGSVTSARCHHHYNYKGRCPPRGTPALSAPRSAPLTWRARTPVAPPSLPPLPRTVPQCRRLPKDGRPPGNRTAAAASSAGAPRLRRPQSANSGWPPRTWQRAWTASCSTQTGSMETATPKPTTRWAHTGRALPGARATLASARAAAALHPGLTATSHPMHPPAQSTCPPALRRRAAAPVSIVRVCRGQPSSRVDATQARALSTR